MPDKVCDQAAVILPATPKQDGAGVGEETSSCSSQSGSMLLEEQVMQTLEMLRSGWAPPPPAASAPGQSAKKKRKRRSLVVHEASGGEDADEANATSLVFTRRRAGQPARLSSDPVALTKSRLEALFNLPIRDAADILGISITALKKACRRIGVERWPYKKVRAFCSPGMPHAHARARTIKCAFVWIKRLFPVLQCMRVRRCRHARTFLSRESCLFLPMLEHVLPPSLHLQQNATTNIPMLSDLS